MEKRITYQKLGKKCGDKLSLAQGYYNVLSAFNNLSLTEREVQLVAFAAVNGNMTDKDIKEEFYKKYKTTAPTVNNIVSRLKKKGVIVKRGGKIVVEPAISINFDNDVLLEMRISHD